MNIEHVILGLVPGISGVYMYVTLFPPFSEKSRVKKRYFAIVRTMLGTPCFANMGVYTSAQKVQSNTKIKCKIYKGKK